MPRVSFEQYQFELIESDITGFSKHEVAILFFTSSLYMQEKLGDYLVLSQKDHGDASEPIDCITIQLQPFVSVAAIKNDHHK